MFYRRLGRSGITVSALGLGTARIGGLGFRDGPHEAKEDPSARVDSIQAIDRAIDLGVTFFDTADSYGAGRSECLLGDALDGRRARVTIATKFGEPADGESADAAESRLTPAFVRAACEASLDRLRTDWIDLYLLHHRSLSLDRAAEIRDALESLVAEGKIRSYGWSTDDVERARRFAAGAHCTAIEHRLNVLEDAPAMLDLCEKEDLASINRVPLMMGVLTGRWTRGTRLPAGDRRRRWFQEPGFLDLLERVDPLHEPLTAGGRSVVQGALGWIWGRHERTIPIPGFRTAAQVEELSGAARFGPLSPPEMAAVARARRGS